jgi:hypothetical protein
MVDATSSPLGCAIWRVRAASGLEGTRARAFQALRFASSGPHRYLAGIGESLPPRPEAASSRPDGGDPVASTI